MEKVFVNSSDGYRLELHVFDTDRPAAVIQLVHGMQEHQECYEPFVRFLNENGFAVVSSDLRGHGRGAEQLGYFGSKKGYLRLIDDQRAVTRCIRERFSGLPIYIFAHSMGTIITRVLLQESSADYRKIVLSGYPCYQRGAAFGIMLTRLIRLFRGAEYVSDFVGKTFNNMFNKQIENPRTNVDWICGNDEIVDAYIKDPYCGFDFTVAAFSDLFHLNIQMNKPNRYHHVNQSAKILMIRGENDPCVGGEKGALHSRNVLKKAGFDSVRHIDYADMRHQVLDEKDNARVYADILDFYRE